MCKQIFPDNKNGNNYDLYKAYKLQLYVFVGMLSDVSYVHSLMLL